MLDQVEYYTTSEDEAEASNMNPSSSVAPAEMRRLYDDKEDEEDEEDSLVCVECGAVGDVLEEGGDQSEFRLSFYERCMYWWLTCTLFFV